MNRHYVAKVYAIFTACLAGASIILILFTLI